MLRPSLEEIHRTREQIASLLRPTPVKQVGPAFLKLESLQPTGSFKVRGFAGVALGLSDAERADGLLTVSAGNAALACAWIARQCGVPCRVFMFDTAPAVKADGVRALGAEVVPLPRRELLDWMENEGWRTERGHFIHPFADVVTGHGSCGLELLEQIPDLERVVVPVGGGGLISGIASAIKAVKPDVEIVGVQSEGYPMWPRVFEAGGPVDLEPKTIADGTAGPFHRGMFELLPTLVDRWVLVPEASLRHAVRELAMTHKLVVEGAGALPFAALDQLPTDETTAVVISGGNIDATLLAEILRG